jgi:predicted transcriptional regulator
MDNCYNNNRNESITVAKNQAVDFGSVPAEDRRVLVLEFLAEHDMPLPPLAIYAGLVRHHRITFSYRTVQNILSDLTEGGDLYRVDTSDLRDGEITPIGDDDSSRRRAYYHITEQGKERID